MLKELTGGSSLDPRKQRFQFQTQKPRDDGCGIVVLQMLTGMDYNKLAAMIDWGKRSAHHTTWEDICGVLTRIGWTIEQPAEIVCWSDMTGVAIVHVQPDHFILYDSDNGCFYDPASSGPQEITDLVPKSYLAVGRRD